MVFEHAVRQHFARDREGLPRTIKGSIEFSNHSEGPRSKCAKTQLPVVAVPRRCRGCRVEKTQAQSGLQSIEQISGAFEYGVAHGARKVPILRNQYLSKRSRTRGHVIHGITLEWQGHSLCEVGESARLPTPADPCCRTGPCGSTTSQVLGTWKCGGDPCESLHEAGPGRFGKRGGFVPVTPSRDTGKVLGAKVRVASNTRGRGDFRLALPPARS